MSLTITTKRADRSTKLAISPERLYKTTDGTVVSANHPDRRWLYVGEGAEIPKAVLDEYQKRTDSKKGAVEVKESQPEETKESRPEETKKAKSRGTRPRAGRADKKEPKKTAKKKK